MTQPTVELPIVELKPCPIDGGKAEWREHPIRGTGSSGMEAPDLSIRCTACGLETTKERTEKWERGRGTYSIRDEAEAKLLARWNTRPEDNLIKEAVEALTDGVSIFSQRSQHICDWQERVEKFLARITKLTGEKQ